MSFRLRWSSTNEDFFCTDCHGPGLAGSLYAQETPSRGDPNSIPATTTKIEILDQVEITVDIPGTIVSLKPNHLGGIVQKGDVVVELDSNVLQKQVAEAEAKANSTILIDFQQHALDAAQHKLDSKNRVNNSAIEKSGRPLFTPDEIRELELDVVKSQAELKKAKEDKLLAKLALDTKQAELAQYTRTAHFTGIVTDLHKKGVGSGVRQGDPIMTIVNLDKVLATLTLSPEHESRVRVGDTVLVKRATNLEARSAGRFREKGPTLASAAPVDEEVFVGKVVLIRPQKLADDENSFEIDAEIQNREIGPGQYLLKEGSFTEAVVISPQR
ncbi:MAG: HlyD family efflux transporter periplasmic adaptor subunit [Planctomycetaceae bacterium]